MMSKNIHKYKIPKIIERLHLTPKSERETFEFSKLSDIAQKSFHDFFQPNIENRENKGLEKLFRTFFPITQERGNIRIDYQRYVLFEPELTPSECSSRGTDYAATIKVYLIITNLNTGEVIERCNSMGRVYWLTEQGTFIINGHERIYINQLQRCPGVVMLKQQEDSNNNKYELKISPDVGSWIYIFFEKKTFWVSIDKRKKIPLFDFLLSFPKSYSLNAEYDYGNDLKDILDEFYTTTDIIYSGSLWQLPVNGDLYTQSDLYLNGEFYAAKHTNITYNGILQIKPEDLKNYYLGDDILATNGKVLAQVGSIINVEIHKISEKIKIFNVTKDMPEYILNSIEETTRDRTLMSVMFSLKIGLHYGVNGFSKIFAGRFFDSKYYDLSDVGRKQLNILLGLKETLNHLTINDIIASVKRLMTLVLGKAEEDDIDSLKNKKVYTLGQLLESLFRAGFVKFYKNVLNRPINTDIFLPNSQVHLSNTLHLRLILFPLNDRIWTDWVAYDNTNYISSSVQKLLLVQKRNGADAHTIKKVRNINPSFIPHIDPGQTSEGKNTGLKLHRSHVSIVNNDGFLAAPYYVVENGKITEKVEYLSTLEEENKVIAFMENFIEKNGELTYMNPNNLAEKDLYLKCRLNGHIDFFNMKQVNYVDVKLNQICSFASSLIPFVGNNYVYRNMVAANMLSQSVPPYLPKSPFVGTGMEEELSHKIVSPFDGIVKLVDCKRIVIESEDEVKSIKLIVNKNTNGNTTILHRPLVSIGDEVKKHEIIADGESSHRGSLALGNNLLVAMMCSKYNYEDACYTSTATNAKFETFIQHVFTCEMRSDKYGNEKITNDIPGVKDVKNLNEEGIIKEGSRVKPNDILVGKLTPYGTNSDNRTSEQKLLDLIFSDTSAEYRDTSLRMPHGLEGIVVKVEIFTRVGVAQNASGIIQNKKAIGLKSKEVNEQKLLLENTLRNKLYQRVNKRYTKDQFEKLDIDVLQKEFPELWMPYLEQVKKIDHEFEEHLKVMKNGYNLQDDVLRLIKVYVNIKRGVESGDKLCGRHGNKGVVSYVAPVCDMPYLKDGTPVDLLISPLGVMSRMNVGQILETTVGSVVYHLRKKIENEVKQNNIDLKLLRKLVWQAYGDSRVNKDLTDENLLEMAWDIVHNGIYVAIEQFKNLTQDDWKHLLEIAGIDESGKIDLYDGKTGEKFKTKALVGYQFILRLHHFVSDKIHARSIGPYSLVNQQPLGGRAQFGGQRLGEMEVWAFEGYGASFALQESLGMKSDDTVMRQIGYSSLQKGNNISLFTNQDKAAYTASFHLLTKELMSAGFELKVTSDDELPSLQKSPWNKGRKTEILENNKSNQDIL